MTDSANTDKIWRKPSRCSGANCVEVLHTPDMVWIRRTGYESYPIAFTPEEWGAFLRGAKAGEFD